MYNDWCLDRQSLNPERALVASTNGEHRPGMVGVLHQQIHSLIETFKVGSGRMLVPAYRALGWTGSSGPDAVSHFASLKLSYESKYVLGFSKLYTWLNLQQWFNTGKEGKGLDAHEEDAEPALAAAGYQGQQAEGEHTLQGQKRNVLSKFFKQNVQFFNVQGDCVSLHIFLE